MYVYAALHLVGIGLLALFLAFGWQHERHLNANALQPADQAAIGQFMLVAGGVLLLIALIVLVLQLMVAHGLRHQRRRALGMVVAALICLNIPLGTALGIWLLVLLQRPSVRALFASPIQAATTVVAR